MKKKTAEFTQGWLTTDEQEIKRRQLRGETEVFNINLLENEIPPFGTYRVQSTGGFPYEVEIRSLTSRENSCGCPDFSVNGLGTCKHIEGVLHHLKKKHDWKKLSQLKPSWMEVYLDNSDSAKLKLWNSELLAQHKEIVSTLNLQISSSNIIEYPNKMFPSIKEGLENAPKAIREKIRLSRFIEPWLDKNKRQEEKAANKQQFLDKVARGEESFDVLNVPLYPYQQEGMLHLVFNERALLADEMGLGKTIQAIAACVLLRKLKGIKRVLIIVPASLKTEWEEQIVKFTGLPVQLIQGSRHVRLQQYKLDSFFFLANYEQVRNDLEEIQELLNPDVIVLDEAQRIKNWQAKTSTKIKKLQSPYAFVLTGTPLENRIDEIYSLMQVVDPNVFGPLFRFNRDFYVFDEKGKTIGLQNIDKLHAKLKNVLLRRRKNEVEDQLPERIVNFYFVAMEEEQRKRYTDYEDKVARLLASAKERPLRKEEQELLQLWLACMRMICDTPYILDKDCKICPKITELEHILAQLLANKENKIIIFSEWVKMLDLVQELLKALNIDYAVHTGSVPQDKRRREINRFKEDPNCRVFLSSDSGATGLNLQVANVVINLDLPWNPAKYEQRIARAWRKHQKRIVQIINLVCEDSIEQRMINLLSAKKILADGVLDGVGDLEQMDLPSGKGSFLEKLDTLMGVAHKQAQKEELQDTNDESQSCIEYKVETSPSEEVIKDRILEKNSQAIVQIDLYKNEEGKKTLVAVSHRPLDEAAALQNVENDIALTVLDPTTFDTIQKLIKAGVLQMTDKYANLYQSKSAQEASEEERLRRLKQGKEEFKLAQRKLRMGIVLAKGEFFMESETPIREALAQAWKIKNSVPLTLAEEILQLFEGLQLLSVEEDADASRLLEGSQTIFNAIEMAFT